METRNHLNGAYPKSQTSREKLNFMRKIFFLICLLALTFTGKAQDVRRTFGVGLQSSFPSYGISLKYGVTERSVVQATVAPFGTSFDGGSIKTNFYGLRYLYRFPDSDQGSVSIDPYLFAGGGLLRYVEDFTALGLEKTSENMFGYSGGAGAEFIFLGKFGVSAELGYGKMSFSGGLAVNTLLFGAGLHFYIN